MNATTFQTSIRTLLETTFPSADVEIGERTAATVRRDNDFDEASYGPWEWDLKRMVTSVVIAARHKGYSATDARGAAIASAVAYRDSLRSAMQLDALERFYVPLFQSTGDWGPTNTSVRSGVAGVDW